MIGRPGDTERWELEPRDRWRRIVGRIFGDAENPLGWALSIGRVSGIRVRVHLLFIVYAAAQLLWAIPRDTLGIAYQAMIIGALFALVLLHEFGHCVACRRVGGEADDILMWPLGGLASCAPPETWRAHLATALGGPAVNLALLPVFAGALALTGHAGEILFNPLEPALPLGAMESYGLAALWIGHYVNLVLLAFNVLCPMYPLDGGRIVQCLIWRRAGLRRSMELSVVIGFVTAGALGVLALVSEETMLLGIAVFGGLVCYDERRKLRAEELLTGVDEAIGASRAATAAHERERRAREAAESARLAEEEDRVLAKIAAEGMGALTKRERRVLEEATRRRGGSGASGGG